MKRYLPHGLFALLVAGLAFAQAQSINKSFQLSQDPTGVFNTDTANNAYFPAHMNVTGLSGTVSSCGTTPTNAGSDMAGSIVTGTGATTSCTLTFRNAYNAAPFCTAVLGVTSPVGVVPTSQGVTFSYSSQGSGAVLQYQCNGRSGG